MGDRESRADDARQEWEDKYREQQLESQLFSLADDTRTHIYWCERVQDGWEPRCRCGCIIPADTTPVVDYEECLDYAEQLIIQARYGELE